MKMKIFRSTVLTLAGIALVIAWLITSIFSVCFNLSFYEKEYAKLNTAQSMNMEYSELMRVTDEMVDYLKDNRENLDIPAVVNGEQVEFFNEREKLHMIDVLKLADMARYERSLALVVGIAVFLMFYYSKGKDGVNLIAKCFLVSEGILLLLSGALGLFIATGNFDIFWVKFHQLVFTNDLWLLDPRTDRLINLVPETFFFDLCVQAIITFVVGIIIASIVSIILIRNTNETRLTRLKKATYRYR